MLPGAASARSAQEGFGASFRLAYGIPAGKIAANTFDVGDIISGTLPLQLDLGYRFSRNFSAAFYGSFAPGFMNDDGACYGGDCSGKVVRFGIEGIYHFTPRQQADPWLGVGIGYEWASLDWNGWGMGAHGWEFLNLQLGVDFRASREVAVGPFVSFSLSQYDRATGYLVWDEGATTGTASIPEKALHHWIQLGVRCSFNL